MLASGVGTGMGELLPYRPAKARSETTAFIGMVVFLASWAMMFAALFFAYGYVRSRAGEWPPEDLPALPLALPALNTAVLLASSALLQGAVYRIKRAHLAGVGWLIALSGALGAVFLALQLVVWAGLYREGLRPDSGGPYASVFYGLTWFHALHVLVGLIALAVLAARAFKGAYSAAKYLPVRLWTLYWHFVGIVWALMFASVFVL